MLTPAPRCQAGSKSTVLHSSSRKIIIPRAKKLQIASKTNSPQKGKLLKVPHATWAALPSTASLVERRSKHRSLEIKRWKRAVHHNSLMPNLLALCMSHGPSMASLLRAPSMLLIRQPAPTAAHPSTHGRTPQHPRPHRHAPGDRPVSQLAAEATTHSLSHQVGAAVVPASLFPAPWQQESTIGTGAVGDPRGKAQGEGLDEEVVI